MDRQNRIKVRMFLKPFVSRADFGFLDKKEKGIKRILSGL